MLLNSGNISGCCEVQDIALEELETDTENGGGQDADKCAKIESAVLFLISFHIEPPML